MVFSTRRSFLAAAGAVALAASGIGGAHAQDVWKIPMMESFSGAAADWGADMFTGAQVAAEMINAKGGILGKKIEFYKADAPYDDVPQAITMFRKLARDKDVNLIFDGGATSVIAAVHDLAGEFKIPIYAFSSGGHWKLPGFNDWVFRSLPMAQSALPVLMLKAQKKWDIKKAVLMYTNDDEAMRADREIFTGEAKKLGIEVLELSHRAKETDYSAQITRAKAFGPQAFFISQQAFDAGAFIGQARAAGMDQPVIGNLGTTNAEYIKMSKGRVGESVMYGFNNPHDTRPDVVAFRNAYKAKFGKDPSSWATLTADGAFVTADILNAAKQPLTREGIQKAFLQTKAVHSFSGAFGWNGKGGDANRSELLIVRWEGDKLLPVPAGYFPN